MAAMYIVFLVLCAVIHQNYAVVKSPVKALDFLHDDDRHELPILDAVKPIILLHKNEFKEKTGYEITDLKILEVKSEESGFNAKIDPGNGQNCRVRINHSPPAEKSELANAKCWKKQS